VVEVVSLVLRIFIAVAWIGIGIFETIHVEKKSDSAILWLAISVILVDQIVFIIGGM